MDAVAIYKEQFEVNNRLFDFGVTIEELRNIAIEAASARNDATILHPANAPGMYSYMAGVAALRMIFVNKQGWEITKHNGVEGISNKDIGAVVLFQNVDVACSSTEPCPISSKGNGVAGLVENPVGYLWPYMEEEDRAKENTHVWFFCVSSNDDNMRAELSRPRAIKNGSFGMFAERIFIVTDDDLDGPFKGTNDIEGDQEIDIRISKKI